MNYPAASSGVSNTLTKRVRSKLLAMNPKRGQWPVGYRRQREYPQPPPPSKNNTKITINKVSIVSPLFGLSILNSVGARCVPDLVGEEKAGFFYTAEVKKRESLGEIVETLDQKVETRLFSSATVFSFMMRCRRFRSPWRATRCNSRSVHACSYPSTSQVDTGFV
jgi:hypothetical protein